jgi:hypothetical protein
VRQGVRDDEVTGGVTLRQGRSHRTQEGGRGLGWELGKKIDLCLITLTLSKNLFHF